jgi:hypothetical protein
MAVGTNHWKLGLFVILGLGLTAALTLALAAAVLEVSQQVTGALQAEPSPPPVSMEH